MSLTTPRERAEYFINEVWPRVGSLADPYRFWKTLSLSLAHDVLQLTKEQDDRSMLAGAPFDEPEHV